MSFRRRIHGQLVCALCAGLLATAGCEVPFGDWLADLGPSGLQQGDGVVAGVVEDYLSLTNRQVEASGWDAPDAPIVAYAETSGLHLPGEDVFGGGIKQVFLTFDDALRLSGVFSFDVGKYVVFIEELDSFAALGATAQNVDDNARRWRGTYHRTVGALSVSLETILSLTVSEDGGIRARIEMTYTYTATEAIATEERNEREAIQTGASATWRGEATFAVAGSAGPYAALAGVNFRPRDAYHEADAPPTLAGIWEVTHDEHPSALWGDPNAPLARYITDNGNPFADWGGLPDGTREFLVFDANDMMTADYWYDPETDTVEVATVANNPMLGETWTVHEDGTLRLVDLIMYDGEIGGGVTVLAVMNAVATPVNGGETWQVELDITFQCTALADVPADPETDREAVQAGDQSVYVVHRSDELTPSTGPAVLFPDAVWQTDDQAQTPSFEGTWETIEQGAPEGSWDDANAPLAQLMVEMGNPLNNFGTVAEGVRDFSVFDANNTNVANYAYDSETDTIYVSSPATDPFLGKTLILHKDGVFGLKDWVMMSGDMGLIALTITVDVALTPNEDGETWRIDMVATQHVVAQSTVAANPGTGRPEVQVGDEVVYTAHQWQTVAPSVGPALLFPDADWQIAVDEQAAQSAVMTGYCEVVAPHESYVAWSDPSSLILQWLEEVGSPPEDPEPFIATDERSFLLFDENGAPVLTLGYDPDTSTLGLDCGSEGDPMIGQTPTLTPDGQAWYIQSSVGPFTDPSETLQTEARFTITVYYGDLEKGRALVLEMVTTTTLLQDIPENVGTGRPAIPAGTTVSRTQLEMHTLVSSDSPFALFPGAELIWK